MGTACKFNVITGFVTYEPGLLIALRNCTEDGGSPNQKLLCWITDPFGGLGCLIG